MTELVGTTIRGARVVEWINWRHIRCLCLTCKAYFLVCSKPLKSSSRLPLCHECRRQFLPAQGLKGAMVRAAKYSAGALSYLLPLPRPTRRGSYRGQCKECGGLVVGTRRKEYCGPRCSGRFNNRRRREARAA